MIEFMGEFDYGYFDDPTGFGYQGYYLENTGEGLQPNWDTIAEFLKKKGVKSALDVGCAKGFLVKSLIEAGIYSIGYDVSEYAISKSITNNCLLKDITTGIDGYYDAIIAMGSLLYILPDNIKQVLSDIHQHTHLYFLFSCYYEGESQDVQDPFRKITESREWWRDVIQASGFSFSQRTKWFDIYEKLQ